MKEFKIINLPECESSNSFLKERRGTFEPFTILRCLKQTQGRGRWGRRWFSKEDKGLTFSILFPVQKNDDYIYYPMSVAHSVVKTFSKLDIESEFLWPNDVYVKGKKICGILNESVTRGSESFLISGVGVNINLDKEDFPEPIKNTSISLKMILGEETAPEFFFKKFINQLYSLIDENTALPTILNFLKRNSLLKKGENVKVRVRDREIEGVFEEITKNFRLKIITDHGEEEFFDGEVLRVENSSD